MTGIDELFAELDGRDRYQWALAMRAEWWKASERMRYREPGYRLYQRRYRRNRYRNDAAWRLKIRAYMKGRRAARRGPAVPRPRAEHGTYYMYTKRKCRCVDCRAASASYMRDRRAAATAQAIEVTP